MTEKEKETDAETEMERAMVTPGDLRFGDEDTLPQRSVEERAVGLST